LQGCHYSCPTSYENCHPACVEVTWLGSLCTLFRCPISAQSWPVGLPREQKAWHTRPIRKSPHREYPRSPPHVASCTDLFAWYNEEHHHVGICSLTPHDLRARALHDAFVRRAPPFTPRIHFRVTPPRARRCVEETWRPPPPAPPLTTPLSFVNGLFSGFDFPWCRQKAQFTCMLAKIWNYDDGREHQYLFLDDPMSSLDLHHPIQVLNGARDLLRHNCTLLRFSTTLVSRAPTVTVSSCPIGRVAAEVDSADGLLPECLAEPSLARVSPEPSVGAT